MSNVRTTLSSLLSVLDKGGSCLAGVASSGIDGLDMLNNRIASAKRMQTKEIEADELVRSQEIELSLVQRMTSLVEEANTLQATKQSEVEQALNVIDTLRKGNTSFLITKKEVTSIATASEE